MIAKDRTLKPGLYLVPTPIGHLEDMTFRAVRTLQQADKILCEDTRTSGILLKHYGIATKTIAFHEHNEDAMLQRVLDWMQGGEAIALISDAGTPLISDPGFKLVRACHDVGVYVTSLPGASAVTTALSLSGFATDHYLFAGFFKKKHTKTLASIPYTLIFFTTARQLIETLMTLQSTMPHRQVAVVREISKIYEDVRRGSYTDVLQHYQSHPPKGEIVLLLSPPTQEEALDEDALSSMISSHPHTSVRELSTLLSEHFQRPKKDMYARILKERNRTEGDSG